MQPYFFPYPGYFQLLQAVDLFIVHDRVKYTKKGWINRNRILVNGSDALITVPVRHDSDSLDIVERSIAPDFDRAKLLNRIAGAYRGAPHFAQVFPLVERVVNNAEPNLFRFLRASIEATRDFLGIDTPIRAASSFAIDPALRAQDKVIALCRAAGADIYVNAIGGMELYSAPAFEAAGITLRFIRQGAFEYRQAGAPFVPSLSIIDALMFCPVESLRAHIDGNYELVANGH
ncbi:MAG: WbqC family protein [Burkholderiales bacterium]|nr:WbqC family protein [Burkholderiales bacterium]